MQIYYYSPETLFYWIVAYSVYEWIAIYLILWYAKAKNKKTPIEYYSVVPSWVPVAGDFLYTTAILLTAQLIFKQFESKISKYIKSKLLAFVLVAVAVQWIFDLTFAYFVTSMPPGFSKYINFFQRYIKEAKFGAVIADSIWIIGWLLLTVWFMNYVPLTVASLILTLSLFSWLVVKW